MLKLLILTALLSSAETMDEAAQNRLIEKLSQVNLNLAPSDSSKTAIALRLGDLHAERGRRLANEEFNKGCSVCKAGDKDRKKSIELYTDVLLLLPADQKAKVQTQIGHLNELIGEEAKAINVYEHLLKNESPNIVAEAQLSLAEIYFKKRNYPLSYQYYEKVKQNHSSQKGLATYRAGWCLFNMNQVEKAASELKTVLSSQELLSRSQGGAILLDKQFQEEVSRDYATFLARLPFSEKNIAELYSLSPESAKLAHTQYLASEYERLGQVPAAISAWNYLIQRQSDPKARLEGHVHLAQLQAQHQQRDKAAQDFSTSLNLWKSLGACDDDTCKNLKIRLKQFLVDWSHLEKKQASLELLESYKQYLNVFPEAHDLRLWHAQAVQKNNEFEYAMNENLYVAQAITKELSQDKNSLKDAEKNADKGPDKTSSKPKNRNEVKVASSTIDTKEVFKASQDPLKQQKEWLETSLLAALECAELSKKTENIDRVTNEYLSKSLDLKKEVDVRYLRAQLVYDSGQYAVAAERFKELALNTAAPLDIRTKSADLTLDSLVLLKDDVRLESWSRELAKAIPSTADSLLSIARKSILTQATQQANTNELETAWTTLSRFDAQSASVEDKTSYLKNKLILAEKLAKYSQARDAAEELLRQPSINEADREFALSRKAWLAELQFDFTAALAATEKMKMEKEQEQKFLKLALLADLASKESIPYYRSFLKVTTDKEKSAAVARELVKQSGYSAKELDLQRKILEPNPEVYSQMIYEVYAQNGNLKQLDSIISNKKLSATSFGRAALRSHLLASYTGLKEKIKTAVLDSSNQKKLSNSLKSRVSLLAEAEKMAAKAIDGQEWASQVVFLNLLAQENERFYNEVLSLPVPENLTDEDEQQYLNLLSQQAAPHQTKANDIKAKLLEIYSEPSHFNNYREVVDAQVQPVRKVFLQEMAILKSALPEDQKPKLADLAVEKSEALRPSLAQVEKARQLVRENPFEKSGIENLIGLEKQMGRTSMVSYLENRLATIEAQPDNRAPSTKK